jgi:thiol-disulfide isomerase/thioredoxin
MEFGVPAGIASFAARLLPVAELVVAAALIPASTARWGAAAAFVLLVAFSAGIANALAKGRAPDCHCFGNLHSARAGRPTLIRNLGLAALAGFAAVAGPDTEVGDWVADRTPAELVAAGAAAATLALVAVSLWLWSRNRELRSHVADLRSRVIELTPEKEEGLPVGELAPNFELEALGGETRSLESLRAGRPMLLVFLDPGCAPCRYVMPDLVRWQGALADKLAIAFISEGEPEMVRAVWNEQGTDLLLDPDSYVTRRAFRVLTWPSAIAIGRDGRIASDLVYDRDSMEAVIRALLGHAAAPAPGHAAHLAHPSAEPAV